jgi:hypothetical protein
MKINFGALTACLFMACLALPGRAEDNSIDPYEILAHHIEAIGGMEKIQSITSIHAHGSMAIVGSELSGTFELWPQDPLRFRIVTDWGIMQTVAGDNGEYAWHVDANNKIQKMTDDFTIKQRQVQRMMQNFEHLDPDSPHFVLAYHGIDTVGDRECHVVKITNDINETIEHEYYDTGNYYLIKETIAIPDKKEHIFYDNFRAVDGVILPFQETVETVLTGEIERYVYTEYTLNRVFASDIFEPPSEDVQDYIFSNGRSAEDIRFDFIENNIYVPVVIQGKERLWVLDCGASVTVIDSSYAASLGHAFQGPMKAQSATGVVDLYFVTVPSFSLPGITFKEQTVMTMNIHDMFHSLLGLDVAGVLGYDFLSRFVTKIDYANEKLSFYDPREFEYQDSGVALDVPLNDRRMFNIPVTVDNKYSGKWQLDIGANGVDFHYPYAKAHDLLERAGVDVMFFGAAGPGTARRSRFESMAVGKYVVFDMVIGVPQETGRGVFAETPLVGNIGNTFLRHFVLYLDYYNQQVIFEKGDDFGREFPEGKSGLGLQYSHDHALEVSYVADNTPARDGGFEKGDIIVAINSIKVEYFDGLIAMRRLFREKAGTTYVLTVRRQDKLMDLPLTLRDLY